LFNFVGMLEIITLSITASLGFISLASICGKHNQNSKSLVNKFLIIIIGYQAIRFVVFANLFTSSNPNIIIFCQTIDFIGIALIPCFYFYFENIVYENKFKVVNLIHFIVPAFFIFIYLLSRFVSPDIQSSLKKIFIIGGMTLCYIYTYLGFQLLRKNVWNRKSEIISVQNQNKLINEWTKFLFFNFILLIHIRFIAIIISNTFNYNFHHIPISGLIWNIIFVKILLTPEIFYGYNFLNKVIENASHKVILNKVWNLEGLVKPITNDKDKKMEETVALRLVEIVNKIEELSFNSTAFRNPELGIKDIAFEIKIPISHVIHVFRFHCKESFTDYKKIVRINDATKLLENGFLYDKTIDSLAQEVGFSSYITFYNAFKSITGVTTQEYVKRC